MDPSVLVAIVGAGSAIGGAMLAGLFSVWKSRLDRKAARDALQMDGTGKLRLSELEAMVEFRREQTARAEVCEDRARVAEDRVAHLEGFLHGLGLDPDADGDSPNP